ncbi:hypothetical protein M9Y10_019277 [Tritrichomonas musculus]|uniref:VWFA domain-containing protein n=1 Tax=Tritrichomonas musculus TaxID=1915356 RepID=A0ABR2HJ41_9EUKA
MSKTNQKINDVLFIIDATGSMGSAIRAAHQRATEIARSLQNTYKDVDFQFGCICYRDPVDSRGDKHETLDLTSDINKMVNFLSKIDATGGGDGPEDWVGAYQIALCEISWREGAKTIIHIADADAHGRRYCGYNNHEEETLKLEPLVFELASMRAVITGMNMNNGASTSFNECKKIYERAKGPKYVIEDFSERGGSRSIEEKIARSTMTSAHLAYDEYY